MGLEVVVNEILARGSEEERRILSEAETQRKRLLDAAEGEADEIRARILQETRQKVEALRREHQSASEFEVRRRLLTTQRELADDFRRRLIEGLSRMGKAEREALLAPLIKQALGELSKGVAHARRDDLPLLTKAGYQAGRELSGAGGFQVESEDGQLLLDYRFETLLENAWKGVLTETRKLFEG